MLTELEVHLSQLMIISLQKTKAHNKLLKKEITQQ